MSVFIASRSGGQFYPVTSAVIAAVRWKKEIKRHGWNARTFEAILEEVHAEQTAAPISQKGK